MPRISYVNGRYVPHGDSAVSIEDRGFQFADSVYEVIALINGRFVDEGAHLDRLERSLSELRIAPPRPRHVLSLIVRELARRNRLRNAMVYLQVTRGQAPRDFRFPPRARPTLVITLTPADFTLEKRQRIARTAVTLPDIRWTRRDIKSTGLVAQVLAKQAAVDRGADEALLVDADGCITEGASTNVWMVDAKGRLTTRPPGDGAILKGVTLNALQQICEQEGIPIRWRRFRVAELYTAREVFTTAAISLVTPIVAVDGNPIGSGRVGPVTLRVLKAYLQRAACHNTDRAWSYP